GPGRMPATSGDPNRRTVGWQELVECRLKVRKGTETGRIRKHFLPVVALKAEGLSGVTQRPGHAPCRSLYPYDGQHRAFRDPFPDPAPNPLARVLLIPNGVPDHPNQQRLPDIVPESGRFLVLRHLGVDDVQPATELDVANWIDAGPASGEDHHSLKPDGRL